WPGSGIHCGRSWGLRWGRGTLPNGGRARPPGGAAARVQCAVMSAPAESTARAVFAGIALGLVFGAANAYLGLRVALTVSASNPAAVMTVAIFRSRATLLEANLSQTI